MSPHFLLTSPIRARLSQPCRVVSPLLLLAAILAFLLPLSDAAGTICPTEIHDLNNGLGDTCPNDPTQQCVIDELVECALPECADCIYDFTTTNTEVFVTENVGQMQQGFFDARDHTLDIKALRIRTDNTTSVKRFRNDGHEIKLTATEVRPLGCDDGDPSSIETHGQIVNTVTDPNGQLVESLGVRISGDCVEVREIDTTTNPGPAVDNCNNRILVSASIDLTVTGTLTADGTCSEFPEPGDSNSNVFLTAGHVLTVQSGNGVFARALGVVSRSGQILIKSLGEGTGPKVVIKRKLKADLTGSEADGDGGVVDVTAVGNGIVEVSAAIVATGKGTGNAGGTVDISGFEVNMKSGGAVTANGGGGAGSKGGTITFLVTDKNAVGTVFRLQTRGVTARGRTGGDATLMTDNSIKTWKNVQVSANSGPDGTGGTAFILSETTDPADPNCPSTEACSHPDCDQIVHVNQNLRAHGAGNSAVGGTIVVEGRVIELHLTKVKDMNANAQRRGTGGSAAGAIRLRAIDGKEKINLETQSGADHKLTARKDASTSGTIRISKENPDPLNQPHVKGGIFLPAAVLDLKNTTCANN